MRRVSGLVFGLLLASATFACGARPPVDCKPSLFGASGSRLEDGILALTGVAREVAFNLRVAPCTTADLLQPLPQVTDPENQVQDFEVTKVSADAGFAQVVLRFTPVVPGLHHVSVRVEPNVGIFQGDVVVARDLRGRDGRAVKLPPGQGCLALEELRFPDEGVVCATRAGDVRLYRAGAEALVVDGGVAFASAGQILWVEQDQALLRYQRLDDGGALPPDGTGLFVADSGFLAPLPGGDGLLVRGNQVNRFLADGGGAIGKLLPWQATTFALSADAGLVMSVDGTSACLTALTPDPQTPECVRSPLAGVGASEAGLYALGLSSIPPLTLTRFPASGHLDAGFVQRSVVLPARWRTRVASLSGADQLPQLSGAMPPGVGPVLVAPRLENDGLVLEAFDVPDGGLLSATETTAYRYDPGTGFTSAIPRGP